MRHQCVVGGSGGGVGRDGSVKGGVVRGIGGVCGGTGGSGGLAGPHGIRLHPEGSRCRLSSLAGGQQHDVSRR